MRVLHQYIDRLWPSEFVPLNLIYAEVVTINKNKSDKSILGNHRGILPILLHHKVMLQRIFTPLQSQYSWSFRGPRGFQSPSG